MQMSATELIIIALAATALSACQTSADPQSAAGDLTEAIPFQLDGFQETVLAAGDAAPRSIAVLEVGERSSRAELTIDGNGYPVAGFSRYGQFYLLSSDGRLVIIDGQANLVASHLLSASDPVDLAILSETEAFVTFTGSTAVHTIDLDTGASEVAFELAYESDVPLRCERMVIVEGRLYVAIAEGDRYDPKGGALVAVDLDRGEVTERIDLSYTDPSTGERHVPLNPDLPLVHDAPRNHLIITASGNRPIDPGMAVKIDLDSLEVIELVSQGGAFHGHRVLSEPHQRMLEIRHTSTPVASTHISALVLNEDGSTVPLDRPTILDLFEETDALTLNAEGSLAMIPNSCPVGFCVGGKGISFIDVSTDTLLPKLAAEEAGIVPTLAVFLQD